MRGRGTLSDSDESTEGALPKSGVKFRDAPHGSTRSQAYTISSTRVSRRGTSSVVYVGRSSLAREVTATTFEEEEKRAFVVTTRAAQGVYDFLPEEVGALAQRMPTYSWPKKSPWHPKLCTAFLDVATEYREIEKVGCENYVKAMPGRFKTHGKVIDDTEAAHLQITLSILKELQASDDAIVGPPPSLLASLAETGALTQVGADSIRVLRLARTSRTAVTAAEFDAWAGGSSTCQGGNGLEGWTFKAHKNTSTKGNDDKKLCRTCGAAGWTPAHRCKSPDIVAHARKKKGGKTPGN